LGEPLRAPCAPEVRVGALASGYSRFASLIPARFALGTHFVRRYYPSRKNALRKATNLLNSFKYIKVQNKYEILESRINVNNGFKWFVTDSLRLM